MQAYRSQISLAAVSPTNYTPNDLEYKISSSVGRYALDQPILLCSLHSIALQSTVPLYVITVEKLVYLNPWRRDE